MNPQNETLLSATTRVITDVASMKMNEPSTSGATIMGVVAGLIGGMLLEGKTNFVKTKIYKSY